ncbi:hypothetical protein P389DRAFT_166903 [Cystobasidium minutum MCA 4210]|uniref:uncharacterized protein n=1 Tax=Cystobasidium minutum MCA 4210 TaxID=1397322 RepID=UPI0034CFCA4C|eukprot:jgi/Rhomi1/166903/fgenesh1_kg.2_\
MPKDSKMFGRRASALTSDDLEQFRISNITTFAKHGSAFPQKGITKGELLENIVYVKREMVRWYDSIAWVDDSSHPSKKRTLVVPDTFDRLAVPHTVEKVG